MQTTVVVLFSASLAFGLCKANNLVTGLLTFSLMEGRFQDYYIHDITAAVTSQV